MNIGTPTKEMMTAIRERFYSKPGNEVGGILHIVLDDDNLQTHHIEWSRSEAVVSEDRDAIFICDILLAIPWLERWELLGVTPEQEDLEEGDNQ